MNSKTDRRIEARGADKAMGKKILVVYYSRGDNTHRVAEDIARLLGADIERVIDKTGRTGFTGFLSAGRDAMKKRLTDIGPVEKNPADYDIVVLGTPLWGFGSMTPAIRTYLAQRKGSVGQHALFCTRWFKNPEKLFGSFREIIDGEPLATLAFTTGELADTRYDEYDRKIEAFVDDLLKQ